MKAIRSIVLFFLIIGAIQAYSQASNVESDPFDTTNFNTTISEGINAEEKNKLEYFSGITFVTDVSGTFATQDLSYGSDTRFLGTVFCKATKTTLGSLYAGCFFNYFLYAAASSQVLKTFYQIQSPNSLALPLSLSEIHFSTDIRKKVFIRIGTQLLSWGASYFWSPEDFINRQKVQSTLISAIDQRIGKPGIRLHIPLKATNIFLFTDFSNVVQKGIVGGLDTTIAGAWRVETTAGGINVGTVGYVSKKNYEQLGCDATGNVRGIDIYGETGLTFSQTITSAPDVALSIGASKPFGQERSWLLRGEFYYNETGLENIRFSSLTPGSFIPFYSGKYYGYAELSSQKFFTSQVGISLSTIANGGDGSFLSTMQYNFNLPAIIPFSIYLRYFGGELDRELTSVYKGRIVQIGLRMISQL